MGSGTEVNLMTIIAGLFCVTIASAGLDAYVSVFIDVPNEVPVHASSRKTFVSHVFRAD
jgi:hypothetical protein